MSISCRTRETALIEKAETLLPDGLAVLKELKSRFLWQELMLSIGLNNLHMRLLRSIRQRAEVTLPNMRSSRMERGEINVYRNAKAVAIRFGDDIRDGLEDQIQEPTVKTLGELFEGGWITADPEIDSECRTYSCKFTAKGKRLVDIDREIGDHKLDVNNDTSRPNSKDAQRTIGAIIRRALTQA